MHIIDTCIDAPSTYTPWPMPYPMSQQCNGELCGSCDRHVDAGNAGCLWNWMPPDPRTDLRARIRSGDWEIGYSWWVGFEYFESMTGQGGLQQGVRNIELSEWGEYLTMAQWKLPPATRIVHSHAIAMVVVWCQEKSVRRAYHHSNQGIVVSAQICMVHGKAEGQGRRPT